MGCFSRIQHQSKVLFPERLHVGISVQASAAFTQTIVRRGSAARLDHVRLMMNQTSIYDLLLAVRTTW